MSLLNTLGLPVSKTRLAVGESGPRVQSTVTLFNATGSDLRLLRAGLKFNSARFVPAVPALIPAHERITFQVIESTVGAAKTEGFASYHIEQKRHKVDVTFSWAGATANVKIQGDGPFSQATSAVQDSETGNEYKLIVKDVEFPGEDKLQVRIDVTNNSGFGMTLLSATLDDPEHTEFNEKPKGQLKNKLFSVIIVQALDEEHPEAAGNVVYRIDQPGKPHVASMRWRKGGRPVGSLDPNDGAFSIDSQAKDDRFTFEVLPHDGPPPAPPGPTKVTIINDAGFALKQDLLQLDNDKARFKSQPAQTIDGGRKTQFEVESTDPEFPDTSGIVAYSFKLSGAPDDVEHIVNLDWRSEPPPSFTKIVPPADGVSATVSGSLTDVVFTLTGPELDFKPPEKIKQPTLRQGDKSPDGWVEYLQEALNHHINAGLEVDGDFGGATHKAVIAFQKQHKDEGVLVDGVVGDQTWSFLREGVPEKPHTDGRKPHSFVEKGNEARWVREKQVVRFDRAQDALVMQAVSVGDTDKMQDRLVRIRIVNPDGVKKILDRPIGAPVSASKTGQGSTHDIKVEQFSTLFDDKATRGPPPGDYTVDAFFDEELGGDKFSEVVTVPSN